jgi:4-amino-4-deoxy-L-arabinose transferase-like glycosyltransferase
MEAMPEAIPSRWERWHPVLLLLLAFVLLVPGNGTLPLIDRDEPRFAQATREMRQAGEWIVPTFNGEERLHKPALTYWLMRVSYAVLGVNEASARLHSVASALALVLATYVMGRRWFSARAGFAAAFALVTCLQMIVHGRSAVADMPMILFVATSQWALFELLHRHVPPKANKGTWIAVLYVSLGLGFLAKGPIAWIVPGVTLLLHRFAFHRQPLPWRNLMPLAGLPITLAIVAAWGVPALLQTDGRFWDVGIGEHIIERGTKAFNQRAFTPFYYLLTTILSLFPWSAYAPAAIRTAWKARTPLHAFLLAWFVAPFLVFSFYATQLPHYVMPGYAAICLLIGANVGDPMTRGLRLWRNVVLKLVLVIGLGLLLYPSISAARGIELHDEMHALLIGAGLLLVGLSLVGLPFPAQRGGLYAAIMGVVVIAQALRSAMPSIDVARQFEWLPRDAPAACYLYREPSLMFYGDRRWEEIRDLDRARAFIAEPGPRLLVVPEEYRDLPDVLRGREEASRTFTNENAALSAACTNWVTVEGLNVARSEHVILRAYFRRE